MAYIITCAGTKNEPANIKSSMDKLSYSVLNHARNELIRLFNMNFFNKNYFK